MMIKILLGFVMLSFLFISCKRDDIIEKSAPAQLIGIWKYSKYETISGKDGSVLNSTIISDCGLSDNYEFKNDRTFVSNFYDNINGSCALNVAIGTYEFNEMTNDLITKYSWETAGNTQTVQKITDHNLEIYTMIDDTNDDGFPEKFYTYLYR